ncbi:hypothetical protein BRC86_04605 [Halobacteriales archaeon QS_3_64_16]|nr:MAG: hypothetical protein BRC86_04605 [Halobacteriales archaeon QS_3_64_16]
MSERRSSRRDGSGLEFSRRRVLGATVLTVASAGGLLASVAPARAATTNFGAVAVGTSRTREITTENPVSRPLEVTEITITGADAEAFSVVGGDAPFTVGPDESRTVRIAFEPTSTGEKSAQVRVETSIRSAVAGRLAGRGVEEGAASTSGEEEGSESDRSSDEEQSTGESSETDAREESSAEESSTDEESSESTETDGSDDDSSASGESSPEGTTAGDGDESDEEAPSADGSAATSTDEPSSETTGTDGSSATRRGTDADADTDSGSGVENDPGALLTELLDVNDDGVVNLRDLLRIARRLE